MFTLVKRRDGTVTFNLVFGKDIPKEPGFQRLHHLFHYISNKKVCNDLNQASREAQDKCLNVHEAFAVYILDRSEIIEKAYEMGDDPKEEVEDESFLSHGFVFKTFLRKLNEFDLTFIKHLIARRKPIFLWSNHLIQILDSLQYIQKYCH